VVRSVLIEVFPMKQLFVLVMLVGLLLTACESAPSEQPNTDTTTDNAAGTQEENTPPVEDTPDTPVLNTEPAQEADARSDFEAAIGDGVGTYKVVYDIRTETDGKVYTGVMTQYMKGAEKMRIDNTAEGADTRMYLVDETTTICSKTGSSWSCFASNPDDAEQYETESPQEAVEENDDAVITHDGSMSLAGVTADCWKMVYEDGTARYCIYDGVPLYIHSEVDGNESELKAQSFTKTVKDSDFVPPAEPSEYPTMPSGYGDYKY
jgi:hypothetical protein